MVKTDRRLKMENETPNYARWIPTAGGYVYDGKVVSKDPQYDEKGNFLTDVNGSTFAQGSYQERSDVGFNGLINSMTPSGYKFVADKNPDPTSLVGMGHLEAVGTQTNTQGSGTDANAPITGAGSLGSLSENTSKSQTGVLGTNTINSPVAGNIAGDFEDRWNKDYDYMVATNNLQGQINLLTERSQRTGEDFTATIDNLTKQREQKIRNIDDQYLAAYNEALLAGDNALANQILDQQLAWRDSVGYQNAMQSAKQREENELQIRWQDDYITGINEIANTVLNLTGNLLNFQYNPYTDQALLMAQGQATARVKEQMNATGMYYSSMTVSAITKTCAELIPVYEKMARQEILDNINALQSTANFLMNLEQSQFNLWKGQIEMQYKANEEKRKEVDAAWDRANMMGYIDNAASAVLGVPAGSLSPNERARLQSIQDQIAKENRALQQDKILAGYKADLEIERMREQNRLNKDYYAFQVLNPKATSTSPGTSPTTGLTYAQVLTTAKAMLAAGEDETSMADYVNSTGLNEAQSQNIINTALADNKAKEKKTVSEINKEINGMVGTYNPSEIIDKAFELADGDAELAISSLNQVKYPKDDTSTLSGSMFDTKSLSNMGKEAYKEYVDFYTENKGDAETMLDNIDTFITSLNNNNQISSDEYDQVLSTINEAIIQGKILNSNSLKGKLSSDDSAKTKEAIKETNDQIEKYAEAIYISNAPSKERYIADAYVRFVNKIANAGDKFDYNWLPGNTGIKSRTEAVKYILNSVKDNDTFGNEVDSKIYSSVAAAANNFAGQGKINQITTSSKETAPAIY